METIESYTVEVPEYALCYIVNNDASGLNDEDIKNTDNFMEEYYDRASELKGHVIFSTTEEEGSFNPFPEFGLACNTVTCKILICK